MDELEENDTGLELNVEVLIKCVLLSLIGVVCIVGNLLVIRTLIFFKYPKIHLYVMIGGLSVADLLKITPEILQNVIRWTHKGDVITSEWCQSMFYLVETCTYVASCHLVALSIIRCIMLTDRAHYSKSYVVHAFISSLVIWVLTMLANIPNAKAIVKDDDYGCLRSASLNAETERNSYLKVAFSYALPLIVIAIVYVVTWYFTQRFFADSYSHRERRLSRMVTLLIVSFGICKLPHEIVSFIVFYQSRMVLTSFSNLKLDLDMSLNSTNISADDMLSDYPTHGSDNYHLWGNIYEYCDILAVLDLALRPFFYAKLSYYFSKSFDEVINCTSCRNNSNASCSEIHQSREGAVRMGSQSGPSVTPLTVGREESPDDQCDDIIQLEEA
ncbi:galanin receptor type 2-like [Mizuhopecten yessoensis]|uniref:Galanin receptor type 2 n=1 Tax=Mizuhopecten yessoensis TaxID=6573 RepID=A0A210QDW3_MIZYE|nr:galanin receptor type 2-like [Mizuhopecten yessoensis]XP_021360523.1 galanin receptor type 2-like [Mizuhopecten yessoensis]OWF46909.1 Galanin receptor type 2 [Mizuhopecten yessoensis]